jgi:uncharacterized protein with FMN-binding domain
MKKALPTIAVSAAGVTWLLHAQGAINADATANNANKSTIQAGPPTTVSSTTVRTAPPTTPTSPSTTTTLVTNGAPTSTSTSSTTTTDAPPTTTTTSKTASRTSDGPVIETQYGPVQVEAVLDGSKLIDVKVLQYPNEARRSQSINSQALPILHDQAIAAQNANIDGVSGATYTSAGYQESLQAALDRAK